MVFPERRRDQSKAFEQRPSVWRRGFKHVLAASTLTFPGEL